MSDLTAVSLFAGIGGFDRAFGDAGIRVVAAVEIEATCRAILARHFPGTALFNDVTEVTGAQLIAAGFVPERGILAGGFPCQDLSIAGRRTGLGGARSGLFWHVMRLADELSPRWLVLENVPGLLSAVCSCPGDGACASNGRAVRCGEWRTERLPGPADELTGDDCFVCSHPWDVHDAGGFCSPCQDTCAGLPEVKFRKVFAANVPHAVKGGACPGGCMPAHGGAMGTVLGALGQLGYGFAYRVLDAQFFGLAQRRERVFIVGCLGDRAAPVEVLLEPESGTGHPAAGREARPDVAATLGSRAGGGRTADLDGHGAYVASPLTTRPYADEAAAETRLVATTLQGGGRRGHRIDAEGAAGGHLIPLQAGNWGGNGSGVGQDGDPSFTLDADGSPKAVAVLPFDTGDPAPTLNGSGLVHVAETAYALTSRASRASREETYIAHPITSREAKRSADSDATNGLITVPAADISERPDTAASEDGTGRGSTSRALPSSLSVAGEFGTAEDVAQTVRAAKGQPGCVKTAMAVRRLTPLECERLQGFPDEWTRWHADGTEESDSGRYRKLGNAVAVNVARWIAGRLVAVNARRQSLGGAA